ncbi:transient receptor potential cation channel [Plakobranchus ocellatus]|uniref:Transient receptor potential cation channel n=1 Tax=Plakobranchus ocellatus TaxID=259542 RepID=A0AAV3YVK0_9GAST|nr:transient receptor potential cation channel [Plakobranchus ocellatus]
MLRHERDDCLRHKLICVYLRHKWKSYGRLVNFLDVFVYCLFMGCLTMFVATHDPLEHYHTTIDIQRDIDILVPWRDPQKNEVVYVTGQTRKFNFTDLDEFDYSDPWFPPEARIFSSSV